jgi:hypothetical protein
MHMHTVPFAEFLLWVARELREARVVKTLGGRRAFRIRWDAERQRLLFLGRKASPQSVVGFAKVWMRWQSVSEVGRRQPSKFQGRTLDRVAAPYLAAIVREYYQSLKRQTDKS